MTVRDRPLWPRKTGATLLLVPIGAREDEWALVEQRVCEVANVLDVRVARGLAHCPSYVSAGVAAASWINGKDVLVFACPSDIGVFEAAPLVCAAQVGSVHEQVGDFFCRVTEAVLTLAPRVAWIAAHEWEPKDRVRCCCGDVESLVRFATSPGAWRTTFVGASPLELNESADWPYCYVVHSSAPCRSPCRTGANSG